MNEKELLKSKKILNPYLDKRCDIMKITQFKLEGIFGDNIGKDKITQDQITKPNNFLAKMMCV